LGTVQEQFKDVECADDRRYLAVHHERLVFVRSHRYSVETAAGGWPCDRSSAAFNVWLLFYALRRKLSRLELLSLKQTLLALTAGAVLAGEGAFLIYRFWDQRIGHASLPQKLGAVFVPMILAGIVYGAVALWLKVPAAHEIFRLLRTRLGSAGK